MPGCRPIKVAVGASQWRKPNENIRSSIVQRNFSTMSSSDRIMERLGSIQEKMDVSLQSNQELGLKLRFAAERGKLSEVRKLLSGGAPAMKDAVSFFQFVHRSFVLAWVICSGIGHLFWHRSFVLA